MQYNPNWFSRLQRTSLVHQAVKDIQFIQNQARTMTLLFTSLVCLFSITFAADECKTPNQELGKCVPLASCPALLWAFSNPKYEVIDYLRQFICSESDTLGYIVCCRHTQFNLIFENYVNEDSNEDVQKYPMLKNSENCGKQLLFNNPTDNNLALYEFPWLVKLVDVLGEIAWKRAVTTTACIGSLINERYVLINAQCFYLDIQDTESYYVRIDYFTGETEDCKEVNNSYTGACSKHEVFYVEETITHPFFEYWTNLNDIALLRLSRRVVFTDYLVPVCLPLVTEVKVTQEGVNLYKSGWTLGLNVGGVESQKDNLLTRLITNKKCQSIFDENKVAETISVYDMCSLTQRDWNKTCLYGVGNHIMHLHENKWQIEGIAARGSNCEKGIPDIHTRVHNYLSWINDNVRNVTESCQTPFGEEGECVYLYECPSLLEAFSNPRNGTKTHLRKFVCQGNPERENYILVVCCGTSPNFKIFEGNEAANTTDLVTRLSDTRFCGYQHRDDYISDNPDISVDEFPWLAAVLNVTVPADRTTKCGGVLISARYVVTSASCIASFRIEDVLAVRLGEFNIFNETDCINVDQSGGLDCAQFQDYGVERETIHPFYTPWTLLNDIALLRLNKTVVFSDFVRPICLPKSDTSLAKPGDFLYTTGFGNIAWEVPEAVEIKKKVQTLSISNERCQQLLRDRYSILPVTSYHMCTSDLRNSTIFGCVGDIGGPAMIAGRRSQWYLEGVLSSPACNDDEPQTYTRIAKYLTWIAENIDDPNKE